MTYEDKTLAVSNLYLDQRNPRIPEVANQRDAIQAMLEEEGEKIANLANDIYERGLNPSSRLIVFKEDNRFTDGDGNRRLTALKILETPSLADSHPRIKKKIQQSLKKNGSIPTEVACVVFKGRKHARQWIENNHDGEQEGRGLVRWNAEQKDRFRGKPSIGLEALDYLAESGDISDEDRSRINKSTLDRLLGYKDSRKTLSVSREGDKYGFHDKEKLKQAVLGLRDEKVDRVYTAAKGREFLSHVLSGTSSVNDSDKGSTPPPTKHARSKRKKGQGPLPFGGKLALKAGAVNNLYRDIESLFYHFNSNRNSFTESFIVIFRMSLRVLAETAAKDHSKNLKNYLLDEFDRAKMELDQNTKTTLANQEIKKDTIVRLLQTGGHDYDNSRNEEQAIALSIVLGRMLVSSHGKGQ